MRSYRIEKTNKGYLLIAVYNHGYMEYRFNTYEKAIDFAYFLM